MRTLLSIILFASLVSCQTKEKAPAATAQATALKTIEISVKGMSCEGCENTIKESVSAIDGVSECKASFKEGKAVVKYDTTKTNTKALESAIVEAGYEVTGQKDIK